MLIISNFATEVLFLMKSEQVREKLLKDNDYDTINNPNEVKSSKTKENKVKLKT